ncbi:MAG: ribonuclease Y [Dehalococcoidales bacterium]|nr:ribonuclease Y [Dehalococcoidales bacterium]MDP6448890.1 ribonuclease Y [Dehalococcoidales bacterium]MDP6576960.1 ribonuclease Y [Dehalococcoidales bacterium]
MGILAQLAFFFVGIIFGALLGGMAMFLSRRLMFNRQIRVAERKAARMMDVAKDEAKGVLNEAQEESRKIKNSADWEYRERRSEAQRQENRLSQKSESLDRKLEAVEQRDRSLAGKEKGIESTQNQLVELKSRQLQQLELISGISSDEAKDQLIEAMEVEMQQETSRRLHEWEIRLKEEADEKARGILSQAIQRSASEIVAEATVAVVPIPSDEMKGRLIGREGRNIRTLEQATGVDLIVDDTPEAVTLSSFDPVRREVARVALTKLVLDGRIHPARIEEVVAKAKAEVDATIVSTGEQAAYQAGVHGLRPELIKLLGRLKYRTSYGQNTLSHSTETAYLAGMLASDLETDVTIAKRAGLLHDIGKAVDREVEGTHAAIGADLVKQWDKSPEVVQGIAEHHFETESTGLWGFIISAADAISSARPGARRESLDGYLKRMKALEGIADDFKGVEKSYAIQAGREIRILVKPEEIDDLAAMRMARDIVKKIEEGLEYPGQIKVTVLRETRAVDYAK